MNRDKNGRFMKANTTKSNITFSVTKNGVPLDKSLYIWDEKTKIFSSEENNLVLDFKGINGVTFRTSRNCIFTTGAGCTFNTENNCIFKTGSGCIFNTENNCTFNTGCECTFKTDSDCTFTTDLGLHFKTRHWCKFNTSHNCTFTTGSSCTFKTGENCFITRWDVQSVIEIPVGKIIKLNNFRIAGYTIVEEKKEVASCVGKVVEIDGKKYKLVNL